MSIVEANAQLQATGYLRPTRYSVLFGGPQDLIPADANRRLSITCEECSLPGRSLATAEQRIHGPVFKVPYLRSFLGEITMNFRVGGDLYEKRLFEEWMDKICNPRSNDFEYYENYVQNIEIRQLANGIRTTPEGGNAVLDFFANIGERVANNVLTNFGLQDSTNKPLIRIGDEKPIYTVKIREAFPISIQEMSLGHSMTDQIHKVSVTFAYKDYEALPFLTDSDTGDLARSSQDRTDNALQQSQRRAVSGRILDVVQRGSAVYGVSRRVNSSNAPRGNVLPF